MKIAYSIAYRAVFCLSLIGIIGVAFKVLPLVWELVDPIAALIVAGSLIVVFLDGVSRVLCGRGIL